MVSETSSYFVSENGMIPAYLEIFESVALVVKDFSEIKMSISRMFNSRKLLFADVVTNVC